MKVRSSANLKSVDHQCVSTRWMNWLTRRTLPFICKPSGARSEETMYRRPVMSDLVGQVEANILCPEDGVLRPKKVKDFSLQEADQNRRKIVVPFNLAIQRLGSSVRCKYGRGKSTSRHGTCLLDKSHAIDPSKTAPLVTSYPFNYISFCLHQR